MTVVHRDLKRLKLVIDAGAIALSKDRGAVEFQPKCGYGTVLDLQGTDLGLTVKSLSQEHGELVTENGNICVSESWDSGPRIGKSFMS